MPTREERRYVARRLREYADKYIWVEARFVADALDSSMEENHQSDDLYCGTVEYIADLIEPEQDRTCRMTKLGSDLILAGWWKCSECGPVFPPCNDDIAKWALQRCPRCGAKAVIE